VQVFDLYFDERERNELLRSISLAKVQLDGGELTESHRFVQGYWPSFLRRHVPLSEVPRTTPITPGEIAPSLPITARPAPPQPAAGTPGATPPPRAAQSKKGWWDWVPWR
jgi:hypothetical protein